VPAFDPSARRFFAALAFHFALAGSLFSSVLFFFKVDLFYCAHGCTMASLGPFSEAEVFNAINFLASSSSTPFLGSFPLAAGHAREGPFFQRTLRSFSGVMVALDKVLSGFPTM